MTRRDDQLASGITRKQFGRNRKFGIVKGCVSGRGRKGPVERSSEWGVATVLVRECQVYDTRMLFIRADCSEAELSVLM